MQNIIDEVVELLDSLHLKYYAVNECPECGSLTDRKVKRNEQGWRTKAGYECGACGWRQD